MWVWFYQSQELGAVIFPTLGLEPTGVASQSEASKIKRERNKKGEIQRKTFFLIAKQLIFLLFLNRNVLLVLFDCENNKCLLYEISKYKSMKKIIVTWSSTPKHYLFDICPPIPTNKNYIFFSYFKQKQDHVFNSLLSIYES
jgi:hypothetical protein